MSDPRNSSAPGQAFAAQRYAILRGALDPAAARLAADYALLLAKDPRGLFPEERFGARGRYADALTEDLLVALQPQVERVTGKRLLPCYSFLRVYQPGASLFKHLDRASCEYSVTLTLGYDAAQQWPLWVRTDGVDRAIELEPGDMLVYKGAQVAHWRERFTGKRWVQVFLHYVDAEGLYTEYQFDGRPGLGPWDPTRVPRRELPERKPQPDDPCPCMSERAYGECHGRAGAEPIALAAPTEERRA